ncbi:hypothetical protein [Nocardioides astragali]|uniref:Uncharacterized protein n=1 Tax=Nocardioides astragali TaxID=1776736 RepID=A0ABW2N9Q8_9ACTN|nr:hypothetical protein [Nocardioides astragali]
MRLHPRRPAPHRRAGNRITTVAAALTSGALLASGWYAAPAAAEPGGVRPGGTQGTEPLLTPADGAWLERTVAVAAEPTTVDDSVSSLTVDGQELAGERTVGASRLSFDVGSNSIEARYRNYVLVNGEHRIHLPDLVEERATVEVPNEHLQAGENTIEVVTGAVASDCGQNHDDFVLSNIGLELLGEVADGEENEYSYSFGDGSCGSNTSLLKSAVLTFFILSDPQGTTGLHAELDTATLANGEHELRATTESGATVTHRVTVNNAPAGAGATGAGLGRGHARLHRRQQLRRGTLRQPPPGQRDERAARRRLRQPASAGDLPQRVPRARSKHVTCGDRRGCGVVRVQPRRLHALQPRPYPRRRRGRRAGVAGVVLDG